MPVRDMQFELGGLDRQGRPNVTSPDLPAWAPSWAPNPESLDYLTKLATVSFLILGALYFIGVSPLKPFAQAHVAAV